MATTSDSEYAKIVLARLEEFRQSGQYVNVTLKAEGVQIKCHRVLLAAASEYFHAMFQSGLKESRSKVIEVVGTDAETLELLVKYMYSSDIGITVDNVQNILEACHQFQLTSLLKLCEAFMEQHVTADNSVGFYMFAERYSLNSLKEAARSNMADNFNEVVRTSVFCNLTIDGIVDLISDPALKSPPVNSVFEAACIWTRFEHKREALFHRLLEHMPLHLCTESYLTQTVATYPPMRRDDCQQYLQEALQKLKETALLIGGFYDGVSITDIQYLKVQDTGPSWQMLTNMPVKRKGLCAVIVDGGILVTGGFTWGMKDKPRRENAGCRMFDLTTKKWKKMPSLHDARFGHGSVVHGGCVYVGGGRTEDIPQLSTVEVYNQETRQWSRAPDMPKPASPIQMLSCNRYIYVVDRHKELLMLYNPVTRVWEERRDRPEGRNGCNAVILNDRLYVVGGNPSTCVRYDVDSDTWTVLTPPVGIEPWGAAIAYQGKIMLAAGGSTLVAEYTPELDSWSKPAAHMPKKLYTPCMLTIDSSSCK